MTPFGGTIKATEIDEWYINNVSSKLIDTGSEPYWKFMYRIEL